MAKGDIRVLLVLDLIISAIYSAIVIWGLAYIDVLEYSIENVAILTVILATITYLAVLR